MDKIGSNECDSNVTDKNPSTTIGIVNKMVYMFVFWVKEQDLDFLK